MGIETCGPNEVMVVSGCFHSRPAYIHGGRVFVWPGLQKMQKLSLSLMTVTIDSNNVKSKTGVAVNLTGTAQIKIHPDNQAMLEAASELFLGKSEEEIIELTTLTLEGHQNSIIGNSEAEEIYADQKKFCRAVFESAACDLVNMGLYIASYVVTDLSDDEGFFKKLGQKRALEAKTKRMEEAKQS